MEARTDKPNVIVALISEKSWPALTPSFDLLKVAFILFPSNLSSACAFVHPYISERSTTDSVKASSMPGNSIALKQRISPCDILAHTRVLCFDINKPMRVFRTLR